MVSESDLSGDVALEYLNALLARDRDKALKLVMAQIEEGANIEDLYLNVFQSTQREIGRLWQTNQVSVAQEHYCTAATLMIMSQLYPYVFSQNRNGRRILVSCVGGELHEVGARMVADIFEMRGWDTYFLGANTPTKDLLSAIADHQAEILALSVTINFNIPAAQEIIRAIRSSDDASNLKILVGGRPFLTTENLWRNLGADASAIDAVEAVGTATDLLTQPGGSNG